MLCLYDHEKREYRCTYVFECKTENENGNENERERREKERVARN